MVPDWGAADEKARRLMSLVVMVCGRHGWVMVESLPECRTTLIAMLNLLQLAVP